jgi:N6-L-threonylcarbamoyladenine synthase
MYSLGIDTSNYTTSVALYDSESNSIVQLKKLLPVKEGEKGIRQSDAVFHHTVQLSPLLTELFADKQIIIDAVGYSEKPRNAEGSYMPCFKVGENTALSISAVSGVPAFAFSHQCNHIAAALFSSGKFGELKNEEFIAFHISGGTTEMLYVKPHREKFFDVTIIGKTLDLNAGQAIDRTGLMLGLKFPCGAELEKLALNSDKEFKPHIHFENGCCSLSGIENKCAKMIESNEPFCDVAKFCIDSIYEAIRLMTQYAVSQYGSLPLIYAGGVMSDSIIRKRIENEFSGIFSKPEFSCDNAAGNALMAYERCVNK